MILQGVVGIIFAVLALNFPNSLGRTPAPPNLAGAGHSVAGPRAAGTLLGAILFVLWSNLIVTAATNGVNLTDGLDGLAAGAPVMVFGAYMLMGIWQFNQACGSPRSGRQRSATWFATHGSGPGVGDPECGDGRLPLVEHLASKDLHGRYRLPSHRRRVGV